MDKLFDLLGKLDWEDTFHCVTEWEFEANTFRPIIQLPLIVLSDPGLPFSEISGVRLKKKVQQELDETVTLDLQSSGALRANLHFDYIGKVGPDLPIDAFSEAERRLAKYVTSLAKEESRDT